MSVAFPEPTDPCDSRSAVLLGYLDYFRAVVVGKVADLPDEDQRNSRLPSGWSPLSLVKHLTHVERRWLEWGFDGRPMDDPWADSRDGRWFVADDEHDVIDVLRRQAAQTRAIVESHELSERGQPGPRWAGAEPATLERVLLHLVQEYARHAGQLDVVRELIDGTTGE